jgi:hypothetical protein
MAPAATGANSKMSRITSLEYFMAGHRSPIREDEF